jgi:hypothetical protein
MDRNGKGERMTFCLQKFIFLSMVCAVARKFCTLRKLTDIFRMSDLNYQREKTRKFTTTAYSEKFSSKIRKNL